VLTLFTRIIEALPRAFAQTKPSERERGCFGEVYPAFEREATVCFKASRTLMTGLTAKCTDGSLMDVSFSTLYSALEVSNRSLKKGR
jgi:hypothetical protein